MSNRIRYRGLCPWGNRDIHIHNNGHNTECKVQGLVKFCNMDSRYNSNLEYPVDLYNIMVDLRDSDWLTVNSFVLVNKYVLSITFLPNNNFMRVLRGQILFVIDTNHHLNNSLHLDLLMVKII